MAPIVFLSPPDSGERAKALFQQRFGKPPEHVFAAPGRVNLIGEHVDYNGGIVLPFAIDLKTAVAISVNPSGRVQACSEQVDGVCDFPILNRTRQTGWGRYLQGVINKRNEQGARTSGLQIAVASDLPPGAGLSSSAALCVALLLALEGDQAKFVDPIMAGRLCQDVEHEYAGVPCGLMDQLAVLAAKPDHLLQIDFADLSFRHIPWMGRHVLCVLINSGVKHKLAESEYGNRRRECEQAATKMNIGNLRLATPELIRQFQSQLTEKESQRVRHVVTEVERTREAVEACLRNDARRLGQLLSASHRSLRDDYEVSCFELDLLVELARNLPGFLGARLTGGGFGGSIITLLQTPEGALSLDAPLKILAGRYQDATGKIASAQLCYPSSGALALLENVV